MSDQASGVTQTGQDAQTPTDARTPHAPVTETDKQLDALISARLADYTDRHPVFGSFLGLTDHDDDLGDGSRDHILDSSVAAHRYVTDLEALDTAHLSPYWAIERELALFQTRREIFEIDVHRVWERRVSATDEIGDAIFLLLSRGVRPLEDRLDSIASRLEQAPRHIEQNKTRLGQVPPVRLWNEMELDQLESMPYLFKDVETTAALVAGEDGPQARRIQRAADAASAALAEYGTWLRARLGNATDDFAIGGEHYDELIKLRAFDGLSTDDILEIGEQQLAENRSARAALGKQIDPSATEQEVVERIKSEHPSSFDAALVEYREAMDEARQFVIDYDIASLPLNDRLDVIATPEYMRGVMPFAAYFAPPKFGSGPEQKGVYVVTPSVDGEAGAMREHNHASIYNTSIHEAYPGHHLQLSAANEHPSLARVLVDAEEFVEGWGMYSELMMREQGFDTAPEHLVMMHTDAIWRACRIILDVKLQRGRIGVTEATDFMVEQTGFERANAAAEVNRYTYTPTYQLSYLLGRVLLIRLREDEKRRLGDGFSLGRFHDALISQGSIPISFQRRLLGTDAN